MIKVFGDPNATSELTNLGQAAHEVVRVIRQELYEFSVRIASTCDQLQILLSEVQEEDPTYVEAMYFLVASIHNEGIGILQEMKKVQLPQLIDLLDGSFFSLLQVQSELLLKNSQNLLQSLSKNFQEVKETFQEIVDIVEYGIEIAERGYDDISEWQDMKQELNVTITQLTKNKKQLLEFYALKNLMKDPITQLKATANYFDK